MFNLENVEEELLEIKENTEISDNAFNKIINFVEEITLEYPNITQNEWLNIIETTALSYTTNSYEIVGKNKISIKKAFLLALKKHLEYEDFEEISQAHNKNLI